MRRITAGLFITLDGVIEAPQKWNPRYYDDEMNQAVMPRLAGAGAHLYGRRSYELFRRVFTGAAIDCSTVGWLNSGRCSWLDAMAYDRLSSRPSGPGDSEEL